ncbi:MAG: YraN family protein [Planctomycetota bacterium]|nr:MAG: YraN family protein [Planctomycetota bacterium]
MDLNSNSLSRAEIGAAGERAAAQHLADRGYTIMERNLRIGDDEADIVALAPGGAVAIVEVKTRRGPWNPEERVDAVKQGNLVRLAATLHERPEFHDRMFQFDVVAVSVEAEGTITVMHWAHAFDASGSPW